MTRHTPVVSRLLSLIGTAALSVLFYAPQAQAQETDPTAEICLSCCLLCCCGGTPTTNAATAVVSTGTADRVLKTVQYLYNQDTLRSANGRAPSTEMPAVIAATRTDIRREERAVQKRRPMRPATTF